jgi:hypothetical protein
VQRPTQRRQLPDLLQRQPSLPGGSDRAQPLQYRRGVDDVAPDAGGHGQQPGPLVVAHVGWGDPRVLRDLRDGELVVHDSAQLNLIECDS